MATIVGRPPFEAAGTYVKVCKQVIFTRALRCGYHTAIQNVQ